MSSQNNSSHPLPSLCKSIFVIVSWAPLTIRALDSSNFYVTFWQLSLYDIAPPGKRNSEEIERLQKFMASNSSQMDKAMTTAKALSEEFNDQVVSSQVTLKRIAVEKEHWFHRRA